MSLSPSRSPSPAGSPATTLPLLAPSPTPVDDHASPPPPFTPLAAPAPIPSPPFPPTPSPQISSSLPIVTSAPPPPIVTSAPTPRLASPPLPTTVAAPVLPVAAAPPPSPNALPPLIVSPSPPVKLPPGPSPPRLLTPAGRPTTPLITPSTSSPPTPSTVPPLLPATSSTPPAFSPLKAHPPPLVTPSTTSPPPLAAPSTILPLPSGPSDSSPSSSKSASPSPLPSSFITHRKVPPFSASSPLQLPLANGTLTKAERSAHVSTGLIIGFTIGGVVLLLVLSLLCFRYIDRRKKRAPLEDYCKPPCSAPKDRVGVVLSEPSQEKGNPAGAHVVTVIPKHLGPLPSIGSYGSYGSGGLGSVTSIPIQATGTLLGFASGTFTYDELAVATNGFSEANLLGEGGFGYVHKGVLQNGKKVAVKQLKIGSHQGEQEFQAEVETISRIHHKHLVSLIGYCITGAARLLVYEFVPNNTLEFHLHGEGQLIMEWETRLKIAIGSAKGLAYLHEDCSPKIIHRDIKASNILLDSNLEAKVSDFGLAKILSDNSTHISTRVVGTFGYLAPEYASSGKLTDKSDVYSYGVMLLELISGRPPINKINSFRNESLVDWARPLLNKAIEDGNFDALVDPKLENNYNCDEMASMVACAAACVRHSAWLRPQMSQVIRALEGHVSLTKLDESISPGQSTMYSSSGISNYYPQQEEEETPNMSLSGKLYGISQYSDITSVYGLNPSGSSGNASKQTLTEL